jgi:ABC-2 type transport system ATP-binding protein
MDEVLKAHNVSAGYCGHRIVEGVDLLLRKGDVLGLLGANGSGKSTLIKALTGQIRLLDGGVEISGIDLASRPEQAKAGLGLAVEPSDLPDGLTGRQYFELVASIRDCPPDGWPLPAILERLRIEDGLDRLISACSLGTRAKIGIAAALLGAPPLLIFDESLNGLDPVAAWEAKSIMTELAATRRHAILVSTHVVETVPTLCTRALLLSEGRLAQTWTASDLAEMAPAAFEKSVMRLLARQSFAG